MLSALSERKTPLFVTIPALEVTCSKVDNAMDECVFVFSVFLCVSGGTDFKSIQQT